MTCLVLSVFGSWTYAAFMDDPVPAPASIVVPAVRPPAGHGDGVRVAAAPSSTAVASYWPPGTPRHPACNCGGGGCNCAEAGKCVVVDADCEPGIKRLPTASIAPLPVPAVVVAPPVVVSTVAPPPPLWRLRDRLGRVFTHRDRVVLETWMVTHNAALSPPVVTTYYTAPPVYQYALPAVAPSYGGFTGSFGFGGGYSGGGCAGGNCR